MKKNEGMLLGAAIAAGVIGTLATLLIPKREPKTWASQARMFANGLIEREDRTRKNVVIGSVAGGLIGVVAALLQAQASRPDLFKDLVKPFKKEVHKTVATTKKKVGKAAKRVRSTVKALKKKAKELEVETLNNFVS